MSRSTQQVFHICRSCRQSLNNSIWSKPTRSFSTISARRKIIPSFAPTSSPDFDEFLLAWRQKVFTPAALQNHHRALIYKPTKHAILTKEPGVTVTMDDDEEVKLTPIHFYDKPSVQKSLRKFARFLEGNQSDVDWGNLIPFLKGVRMAKQNLRQTFPPRITRKACEVGKEHIIIACAEKSNETGISLRQAEVARELMLGLHNHAVSAGFAGPGMETLARRAEYVARMLEDQLSTGGKLKEGECDARKDPVVLAVLLEMAAQKAVHGAGDADGRVTNYAEKLLHLEGWQPSSELTGAPAAEQMIALVSLIPIQNSIKWALKIDSVRTSDFGPQLAARLNSLTILVNSTVDSLRTAAGNKSNRSLQMFDRLKSIK